MKMPMQKVIRNDWKREAGKPFFTAEILNHSIHPEGLDVKRLRFADRGTFTPDAGVGHIFSVLQGNGVLHIQGRGDQRLQLGTGSHVYLPPGPESVLDLEPGSELLLVSASTASQARGEKLILRDETFVSACASGPQLLRWVLTPQYLSRRIFLRHDPVLLSKSGNPVSWFRTTMFDVTGLPHNEDGESVFKMSYNSRTEFNVCYDVRGDARVRMALHPYQEKNQAWGPWQKLDSDSTYHLNEAAGSPEEEKSFEAGAPEPQFFRNKHEVYILDGYVTLFCLFDPAPIGIERHRPGEYSDYEPMSQVMGSPAYEFYQREITKYDEMVDQLSMAKAMGQLDSFRGTPVWDLYVKGRDAQNAIEAELYNTLAAAGNGREKVLTNWMQNPAA